MDFKLNTFGGEKCLFFLNKGEQYLIPKQFTLNVLKLYYRMQQAVIGLDNLLQSISKAWGTSSG